MPEAAFLVHGHSDEVLAKQPVFAKVVDELLDFIGDAPLVIHNAAFDINFLNAELGRCERDPIPDSRAIDTVSLARRSIVEEYEQICIDAGAHPGIVDISTFSVLNALLAARPPDGDWLLVHVAPDYASIAIMRGLNLIFFRSRGTEAGGSLADLVHQTAMYYEDRLGGTRLAKALVTGGGDQHEELKRQIADRLFVPVQTLDPRGAAALTARSDAPADVLDALAAPVGVLLREKGAA